MKKINNIENIDLVYLKKVNDDSGKIIIGQNNDEFNFEINRFFIIEDKIGSSRGFHAHKKCMQLLVCLHGSIKVTIDDSVNRKSFILDDMEKGLLVPNMVWAEQIYTAPENKLLVLCNHAFKEQDYIRDYKEYVNFIKSL